MSGSLLKKVPAPNTLSSTAVSSPDMGRNFLTLGGIECVVLNDAYFSRVREYFGFDVDFAANNFSFDDLVASSGKGGESMCQTKDGQFYIKELNSGDHSVLNEAKFAKALCHHIIEPPSVIDPILTHFLNQENGNHYIAMLNVLRYKGKWKKMYDLKGCADDRTIISDGSKLPVVRKRFYKPHIWLGCSGNNRKVYKSGKLEALHSPLLPITSENKELLLKAIKRDTDFLVKHKLMDYSLIVGVTVATEDQEGLDLKPEADIYAGKPMEATGEEKYVLYVGIIDFLQRWNGSKKAAKAVKFLERNKATVPPRIYGPRFHTHFDYVLISCGENEEEQLQRRDKRRQPHRCYPCLRR